MECIFRMRIRDIFSVAKNLLLPVFLLGFLSIAFFAHAVNITIPSPATGASWQAGTTQTITWTPFNASHTVYIGLVQISINTIVYSPTSNTTPDTGSYSWVIPTTITPLTNDYKIYVADGSTGVDYGYGNAFSITAPPAHQYTITSPATGVNWQAGSTQTITWNGAVSGRNVTLSLIQVSPFVVAGSIAASTPDTGSYSWTIPSGTTPTAYMVYLSYGTEYTYGPSFNITAPPSFNYSLSAFGNITVTQGSAGANTITATLSSGTTQAVSYSVSGLPSGATPSFSPTSCNPTCSTTLTITTAAATPTASYPITVTGSPLSRTTTFTLIVNAASPNNSVFVSQTPPPSVMTTGQTANVSVTMQNTGTNTWVQGGPNPYRLGSQNPQDNWTWGFGRVNLPVASVAPGASVTFTFTITAPSTPGTYHFQWRMVQEGIQWFGAFSTNVDVVVNAPSSPPNLSNYAWADNGIGWISFNCSNAGVCGTSNYGVTVNADGSMSGYAWANPNDGAQNHIGWIDFHPLLAGAPVSSFVPNQTVTLNPATGAVSGWARAVGYDIASGWDGWIGFGSGGNYGSGVAVSGCNWLGYAWGGGTVIGWIHFANSPTYQVTGSGNACASVTTGTINVSVTSNSSAWPGTINYSIAGPTAISSINYTVPMAHPNLAGGSYTITYNSGGPAGGSLANITPSATQSLSAGGSLSFTLNFNTPPSPPGSVSAVAASGANACKIINVSWGSSGGAVGYNVGRCVGAGCTNASPSWTPIASMVSGTSAQDTTASDGITYRYGVSACLNATFCSVPTYSSGTVTNVVPEVDTFTWSPSPVKTGVSTTFTSGANQPGANLITSWSWTIPLTHSPSGNSGSPFTTTFSAIGSQNITLKVSDMSGNSCQVTQAVPVSTGTTGGDWCELPPDAPPGTPCP